MDDHAGQRRFARVELAVAVEIGVYSAANARRQQLAELVLLARLTAGEEDAVDRRPGSDRPRRCPRYQRPVQVAGGCNSTTRYVRAPSTAHRAPASVCTTMGADVGRRRRRDICSVTPPMPFVGCMTPSLF
jgi:hypothetical protein